MTGEPIQQLCDTWSETTIGNVADYINGRAFKPAEWQKEGKPIIRIQNLNDHDLPYNYTPADYEEKFLVRKGDLLFAWSASLGAHLWTGGTAWLNQHIFKVVPKEGVNKLFLFYLLKQITDDLYVKAHGSGMVHVTKKKFLATQIFLPSTDKQREIVNKIDMLSSELDDGIASLKKAREQLSIYRQSLLKAAFQGKLTEDWRRQNPDKLEDPATLLARIQREREAHHQQQLADWQQAVKDWEASGKEGKKPQKPTKPKPIREVTNDDMPLLPPGWCWVEYEGLCALVRNGISKKPAGNAGDKIFRISSVRPMFFDLGDFRYIHNNGEYDGYYLTKGDLVFTRYNGSRSYVGVCAEYKSDQSFLYPDKLIRTRLGVESVIPAFLEKAVNSGIVREFIERRIRTTAGQSGISGRDIKSMPVPVCPLEEQREIVAQLESKLSVIEQNEQEIDQALNKAELLRQSILKKAFSGELGPSQDTVEAFG